MYFSNWRFILKNNTNDQENKDKTQNKQIDLTRKQVVIANERTYNSWIRTGLTAVVGGLFIARFLGKVKKAQ